MDDKISGAMFDFMGWLTTREGTLQIGSIHNVVPLIEAFTEWAKMRRLNTDNAQVREWNIDRL